MALYYWYRNLNDLNNSFFSLTKEYLIFRARKYLYLFQNQQNLYLIYWINDSIKCSDWMITKVSKYIYNFTSRNSIFFWIETKIFYLNEALKQIMFYLEIGIGLIMISLGCFCLGVLLFFDRACFLIGNVKNLWKLKNLLGFFCYNFSIYLGGLNKIKWLLLWPKDIFTMSIKYIKIKQ